MTPDLEKELTKHYRRLNKDAKVTGFKRIFTLSNIAAVVGVVTGGVSLVKFGEKASEVNEKKRELAQLEINLDLQTRLAELSDAQLASQSAVLFEIQNELDNKSYELDKLRETRSKVAENVKRIEEKRDRLAILRASESLRYDYLISQLKKEEDQLLEKIEQASIKAQNAQELYRNYVDKIGQADQKLGFVFKYLDNNQLSEQAICELVSVKAIVASRDSRLAFISPNVISVFLSYPNYYQDLLSKTIKDVSYQSDIVLTGGEDPREGTDENGNQWVWQYKGKTPPSYVITTIEYIKDRQLQTFSFKTQWGKNGKVTKSSCEGNTQLLEEPSAT